MRNKDLKQVNLKLVGEEKTQQLFLELIFLSKYNSSYMHVLGNPGVMQEWTQSDLYYECSAMSSDFLCLQSSGTIYSHNQFYISCWEVL